MIIMHRPFRFSMLTMGAETHQEWIDKVCQAEGLGYDSLLFGDHVHNAMAPMAAVAATSVRTTTLRFGSYMFGNDFRHLLFLAHEAATLDVLSDGTYPLNDDEGKAQGVYKYLDLVIGHREICLPEAGIRGGGLRHPGIFLEKVRGSEHEDH